MASGAALNLMLPVPDNPPPEVKISENDRDYRDLFVLAFPTPDDDGMRPVVADDKALAVGSSRIYRLDGKPESS